jgi:two-component system LytT family response regulator
MIKCIIIDDEKMAREAFEKIINLYFKEKLLVIDKAGSVRDGVALIHKHNPDIVFLDIEMPNENGFKLFEYFDHYHFEVIFTTAYKHYAIEAIKYAAIDYLLKPINFIDLRDAIYRFNEKQQIQSRNERMETLLANLSAGVSIKSKVALPTLAGYQMENINNIIYCQADINYTNVFTAKNEKIVVCKTLKIIEEILPTEYFFRIHKSYLVNLNYIKKYAKTDGHFVILENEERLDVAVRRVDDFLKAITNNRD